jgi:aminoethylphosphonate catabolism LysR family transcriptional regulator
MYYYQLRAFHAVATYGGFSKAARQLNISQPAISDQVRKLEGWYNIRLFERKRRSVVPTELGFRLFELTKRMFELENEAVTLLSESEALRTGSLSIAADTPLHSVNLIGAFREAYPGISITLSTSNADDVLSRLYDFNADIAVLADVPDSDLLQSLPLRTDLLVAFVNASHPWANRKTVTLEELCSEPMVMRETGSKTRMTLEEELEKRGLTYELALEAEGRATAREAVAVGIGIGVVSESEFGFDTRLRSLTLSDSKCSMTENLVCLKERAKLRAVAAFWDIATAHVI